MQTLAAPCPGHPAHITGLGGPLQMECMTHLPGIRMPRWRRQSAQGPEVFAP
ncbi:hypothetical protein DFAR_1870016 [Desulfarculales bacterium]